MAAVMAAVPFTANTAKNANIGFNSIEANADRFGYQYNPYLNSSFPRSAYIESYNHTGGMTFRNGSYLISLGWHYDWEWGHKLVYQNGSLRFYSVVAEEDRNERPTGKFIPTKLVWSKWVGGNSLGLQRGGNMVAYRADGTPVSETRTCEPNKTTKEGYTFAFSIETNGVFYIYRYSPSGSCDILWRSDRDSIHIL